MKFFSKKAFTLTELLIAITIGVIILIFTFQLVADVINNLASSNRKSEVLGEINEFNAIMRNSKKTYPDISFAFDFPLGVAYDSIVMENIEGDGGILLGVVDFNTKKLAYDRSYPYYGKKVLGYRYLTEDNLSDMSSSMDIIYSYDFFEDKIFEDLVVRDFQANIYNTGAILDLEMTILSYYNSNLDGYGRESVSQNDMYKVVLDF